MVTLVLERIKKKLSNWTSCGREALLMSIHVLCKMSVLFSVDELSNSVMSHLQSYPVPWVGHYPMFHDLKKKYKAIVTVNAFIFLTLLRLSLVVRMRKSNIVFLSVFPWLMNGDYLTVHTLYVTHSQNNPFSSVFSVSIRIM